MATDRRRSRRPRREPQPGPFEQIQVQVTGEQTRPRKIEELVDRLGNRFIR